MDVHDLFTGKTQNLPMAPENPAETSGCQSPGNFLRALLGDEPTPVRIVSPARSIFAKCNYIAELNRDYYYRTGRWALYLGYPLVFVRGDSKHKSFWAPLFFWKIKIAAQGGAITFDRLSEDGEAESPDFNRVLASWLMRERNITLNPPETENLHLNELSRIVRTILAPWSDCETQFFQGIEPEPFAEPASASPDAAVYPYATLAHGKMTLQAILDDLDQLSKSEISPNECGCLDFFIHQRGDKPDDEISPPSESNKILVTNADASQERVIWQARKSRLTVLQGPPGTGKSQTIVNLIADALRRRERVAVVCEQEGALNVVLKRMEDKELGDLAVKITEPKRNRQSLITRIKRIDTNFNALFSNADENVQLRTSDAIEQHESALDKFHQGLQSADGKPPHGDILARLDAMRETHDINILQPQFHSLCQAIRDCFCGNFRDAKNMQESIGQFINDFNRCDYNNNPWRELKQKNPDALYLEATLSALVDDSATLVESADSTLRAALHSDTDKWFAEHPLAVMHYPGMAETPDIQRGYGDFLCKVRNELGEYLPYSAISGFLAEYRNSGNFNALSQCQAYLDDTLDSLLATRHRLREDEIICALHKYRGKPIDDWPHYFFAAVLRNWREDCPLINLGDIHQIEQERETLESLLQEKQEFDQSTVSAQFNQKLTARNQLDNQNLLRIRGGHGHHKTTVRDLYHGGFNSLVEIYPALLINPDSACQILPLRPGLFDLLIIDEASQMFTADALSLLYRAKRVVISGDKMQMPPSKHFMSSVGDIESGDDEKKEDPIADTNRLIPADGEYSLLDAAEYAVLAGAPNRKMLEVHYRSRAKELIDFSNRAFYDGKLQIPSDNSSLPAFLAPPITLNKVEGKFSNRVNSDEIAEIIVTLKKIWRNPGNYSVGVIVFNTHQRDALKEALNDEPDPHFCARLAESRKMEKDGESQEFFVRSVEHVQGDERDIIVLGTTYDPQIRTYGPLSNKGKGRCRLNVAITRAKVKMFVITSLNIDKISNDGERPADGEAKKESERWFLWMYMKYAHAVNGGNSAEINEVLDEIAPPPPRPPVGEPDSEFERQVGDFLIANNYAVEYQVGESGFRIDIGVKEREGKTYLCGIECDGAPFHSGWSARHRDIWRQSILENKGWEIYRIWSTRWFHNKEAAQDGLLEYLKTLRERNSD